LGKASRQQRREAASGAARSIGEDYRNTQAGTAMLALLAVPFAVFLASAVTHPRLWGFQATLCVFLLFLMVVFSSLSTMVTRTEFSWHFGFGRLRKRIALADIASVQMTRSSWIDGWGIHYTRRGWIYNVSGRDVVQIIQKNGKSTLVGTSDPVGLWEALQIRLDAR